jgi:micrococcal nuclease
MTNRGHGPLGVVTSGITAAVGVITVLLVVVSVSSASSAAPTQTAVIASVTDGDTVRLTTGQRVRLLQIDTPELGSGECYSRAARTALLALTPPGVTVVLETDAALDRVDRYGRLLRYLRRGAMNVNVELIRRGAGAPYFYRGDRGRYATTLLSHARVARAHRIGLWKACPSTKLDPLHAIDTGVSGPPARATNHCDPNYSGGCVPPYPPDVDCADIRSLGIAPVRVTGTDVHRLDGDDDGWGCE